MTWYKFDIWYQYMAGSSMFYHEQGFDEFWKPGGTTAAGIKEVQLSPKGKLVDRFLRVTAQEPDRGTALHAGRLPGRLRPRLGAVAVLAQLVQELSRPARPLPLRRPRDRCSKNISGPPIIRSARKSQKPITGTNEVYVPGVFGDIFDVIFAYPDVEEVAHHRHLSRGDRGRRHRADRGRGPTAGAVRAATAARCWWPTRHLTGPGRRGAGAAGDWAQPAEADGYRWLSDENDAAVAALPLPADHAEAARWRRRADGKAFCAAFDRGKGRLIYLSVPRGLGIDRQAVPVVARLLGPPDARPDAGRGRRRRGMDGQPHGDGLAGDAAQSGRPGEAAAGHHADRLSREPAGDDSSSACRSKTARDRLLADEPLTVEKNSEEKRRGEEFGAVSGVGGWRADRRVGMNLPIASDELPAPIACRPAMLFLRSIQTGSVDFQLVDAHASLRRDDAHCRGLHRCEAEAMSQVRMDMLGGDFRHVWGIFHRVDGMPALLGGRLIGARRRCCIEWCRSRPSDRRELGFSGGCGLPARPGSRFCSSESLLSRPKAMLSI